MLGSRLAQMTGHEAELMLNLVRYEHDHPGYVKQSWSRLILRPYLTPTSGVAMEEGRDEAELQHADFKEIIRKVNITEEVWYPAKKENETVTTVYYAHIGLIEDKENGLFTLFANWDGFLREYFLTAGKAHEKLVGGGWQCDKQIDSFRNYAPALYRVLTEADSAVKAVPDFMLGEESLNVMAVTAEDPESGKDELIRTCTEICQEINTTTHLAVWRRYLRDVWLHS